MDPQKFTKPQDLTNSIMSSKKKMYGTLILVASWVSVELWQ